MQKLLIFLFSFLFLMWVVMASVFLIRPTSSSPQNNKAIKLIKCPVCQEKISTRASTCPHCGDSSSSIPAILYSLAGFSLLLGLQIFQIPIPIAEKRYLYFLLLLSTLCFFLSGVFVNPFETPDFFNLFSVAGILLMTVAVAQLSYVIWKQNPQFSIKKNKNL